MPAVRSVVCERLEGPNRRSAQPHRLALVIHTSSSFLHLLSSLNQHIHAHSPNTHAPSHHPSHNCLLHSTPIQPSTHTQTHTLTIARVREQVPNLRQALLLQVAVRPAGKSLLLHLHPRPFRRVVDLYMVGVRMLSVHCHPYTPTDRHTQPSYERDIAPCLSPAAAAAAPPTACCCPRQRP